MQVKNWMIKKVVTISKNGQIMEALNLMKKYSIRHLPVVEGKILKGLITENDLRQVMIPSLMEEMRLDQVMIKNPVTIGPEEKRSFKLPIKAGKNRIVFQPLDRPTLKVLPNGDKRPLLVGVHGLQVAWVDEDLQDKKRNRRL